MSKHAIKSFSDGLRRELNTFDIKVVTIEPIFYKTPILNLNLGIAYSTTLWNQTSSEVQSAYSEKLRKVYYKIQEFICKYARERTEEVAEAMIDGITLEEPQIYYKCGGYFDYITVFAFSYFPEPIQDFILICLMKIFSKI